MVKWSSELESVIEKEWYTSGLPSVPLFLNPAAYSGFLLEPILGRNYTHFIFNYKEGYGEMSYIMSDLVDIWKIVKDKMKDNPDLLISIRQKYRDQFASHAELFNWVDNMNLESVSDEELLDLLKKMAKVQIDAPGVAHILEAVGLGLEKEFQGKLKAELPNEGLYNRYYVELTTPKELSFLAQEEKDLTDIKYLVGDARAEALALHAKRYGWIQNGYAGGVTLTPEFFEQKLVEIENKKEVAERAEEQLEFVPSPELQSLVEMIQFSTLWQDERKMNILNAVAYMEKTINEIARRLSISREVLGYLGVDDINHLVALSDLRLLSDELAERKDGSVFLLSVAGEEILTGEDYSDFLRARKQSEGVDGDEQESTIYGSIANRGTAVGRVKVCTDLASIDRVEPGDVLVASMTRPEFMPALKKAVAIVTDEGGITCHAAIVARELNIPAVIGTKNATKVLRDGMLVEVRANHGVVHILED